MERSAWTDERLNDLAATLDTNVNALREEIHGLLPGSPSGGQQVLAFGHEQALALADPAPREPLDVLELVVLWAGDGHGSKTKKGGSAFADRPGNLALAAFG